jgi:hypothetical protein
LRAAASIPIALETLTNPATPGIKFKVENKGQYEEYLQELEPIREELGIPLKETMYPDGA